MCRLGKMVREVGGRFGIVVGITYQPLPWWPAVSDGLLTVMSMLGPRETPLPNPLTLHPPPHSCLRQTQGFAPNGHKSVPHPAFSKFRVHSFDGFKTSRHEWTKTCTVTDRLRPLARTGGWCLVGVAWRSARNTLTKVGCSGNVGSPYRQTKTFTEKLSTLPIIRLF